MPNKWTVYLSADSETYFAEREIDGDIEFREVTAHCLACAKTEILEKYGGRVDLRGHNDICGNHLKAVQIATQQEEDNITTQG